MRVCLLSMFSSSTGYLARYFEQVATLRDALEARGDSLRLILLEGDSTDDTWRLLCDLVAEHGLAAQLLQCHHGGKVYDSVEAPQRFAQLARLWNEMLEHVPGDAGVYGHIESDLIWDAQTMLDLIAHLAYVPAIAPMVMDGPYSFYDVWGFRKDGVRFTKAWPYHEWLDRCCDLVQVDSAGSVLFVRAELARKARYSDGEEIVGFCRDIYRYGGSIWLDPTLSVAHPPYGGRTQHQSDSRRAHESVRL